MKVSRRVAQMNGVDAVFLLPHRSAVLPLHARSLISLLDPARLINDADRLVVGVLLGNDARHAAAHPVLVPGQVRQELLQRPHRGACCQRHRFHALPRQLRKLSSHVHGEMRLRVPPREAILKTIQVIRQLRLQPTNLLGIHALASGILLPGRNFAGNPFSGNTNIARSTKPVSLSEIELALQTQEADVRLLLDSAIRGRSARGPVKSRVSAPATYQHFPEYVESNIRNLGKIPSHWKTTKLGFIAVVKARLGWKGLKAEEYVDDGFVFLSTPNIKEREIDFENVNFITEARYLESPEIMLEVGDVLIAKDGSTLGTTNVVRSLPRPSTVNSSIAVIKPRPGVNGVYLYYLLCSRFTQRTIQLMKDGQGGSPSISIGPAEV